MPSTTTTNGARPEGSGEAAPEAIGAHFQKTRSDVKAIQDILDRREKAGKLVAGVAAASHSDMFKGPVSLSC